MSRSEFADLSDHISTNVDAFTKCAIGMIKLIPPDGTKKSTKLSRESGVLTESILKDLQLVISPQESVELAERMNEVELSAGRCMYFAPKTPVLSKTGKWEREAEDWITVTQNSLSSLRLFRAYVRPLVARLDVVRPKTITPANGISDESVERVAKLFTPGVELDLPGVQRKMGDHKLGRTQTHKILKFLFDSGRLTKPQRGTYTACSLNKVNKPKSRSKKGLNS